MIKKQRRSNFLALPSLHNESTPLLPLTIMNDQSNYSTTSIYRANIATNLEQPPPDDDNTSSPTRQNNNNNSNASSSSPRRPSRTSARKVLSVAGKPLRSVGRRITNRFGRQGEEELEAARPLLPSTPSILNQAVTSWRAMASPQHHGTAAGPGQPRFSPAPHRAVTSGGAARAAGSVDFHHNSLLYRLEAVLRQLGLLGLAFLCGAYQPQLAFVVEKLVEYALVAWLTTVGILIATVVSTNYPEEMMRLRDDHSTPTNMSPMDEETPLLANRSSSHVHDYSHALDSMLEATEPESPKLQLSRSMDTADEPETAAAAISAPTTTTGMMMPHPSLEPFVVIDVDRQQRVVPNLTEPAKAYTISTDYFYGKMMILIRTPNVDDPLAGPGRPENQATVDYLQHKQRRFEFQFQIRLKKVPHGRVYFACELHEPVKMGMIQRAFVSAAMAFVKSTNSNFHYSISGQSPRPDGAYEQPHMSFPVEEGMNRVVATPQGETPPVLGTEIHESAESLKKRRKGGRLDWNLNDTYTLSLWSAYVDFLDWRCINLPGIRPFPMSSVIGTQPIYLTLYEIPEHCDKHYRVDMIGIANFEMCNTEKSGAGPYTKQWMAAQHPNEDSLEQETSGEALVPVAGNTTESDVLEDAEEVAVAELGEGIYIRNGDSITLREVGDDSSDDRHLSAYLTSGGGFAVLQERSSSTIVIEKVGRMRGKKGQTPLIHTGDTVRFKLVSKGRRADEVDARYLTVHKGWWLKWIASGANKNCNFSIFTHETEFADNITNDGNMRPTETQSSYLTIGGTFCLRHKRWAKFAVGVAAEGSAAYGGRMLGLHVVNDGAISGPQDEIAYVSDEDLAAEFEQPEVAGDRKGSWIRPLLLQANEGSPTSLSQGVTLQFASEANAADAGGASPILFFSNEHYRMDAPAWLEIMNRTERLTQLVYAIRVIPHEFAANNDDDAVDPKPSEPFVRLRSGLELAQIMRMGSSWRGSVSPQRRRGITSDGDTLSPRGELSPPNAAHFSTFSTSLAETPSPIRHRSVSGPDLRDIAAATSFDEQDDTDGQTDSDWDVNSADAVDLIEIDTENDGAVATPLSKPKKGRQLIGKIARSVKTRTASTGKKVVRQSAKIGKGTVSASKAVIPPRRPRNPPVREPRTKTPGRRNVKRRERDLHVAFSKSMRRINIGDSEWAAAESPRVLAGELCAPEQSTRTVSRMLSKMSSLPPNASMTSTFSSQLRNLVEYETDQDARFLTGNAIDLGVVPHRNSDVISGCVVARCLWESHWREEWCGLYSDRLVFHAPLTTNPSLELYFHDIQTVRTSSAGLFCPLPGCAIMVVETAWLCYYVAFANERALESFQTIVKKTKTAFDNSLYGSALDKDLWQARFWQGFQNSFETSLSSGRGKWADVASGNKMKRRTILNNRRTNFDLDPVSMGGTEFVETLLSASLSFSLDSLKEHPEELVNFLDATSYLRTLSLDELDLESTETYCILVNLYHCLLQHALLFSINGPLHKRSYGHFMRTMCYEIGGDVFSLAELNFCIIRGSLSRPTTTRPPVVDMPKKSNAYRFYALRCSTSLVHFIVNTGDTACLDEVPVLFPECLDEQLAASCADYIARNTAVDLEKKVVILPRVCDVFRSDFGVDSSGSGLSSLRYCLAIAHPDTAEAISALLVGDESLVTIKYQPWPEQYYSVLKHRDYNSNSTA